MNAFLVLGSLLIYVLIGMGTLATFETLDRRSYAGETEPWWYVTLLWPIILAAIGILRIIEDE